MCAGRRSDSSTCYTTPQPILAGGLCSWSGWPSTARWFVKQVLHKTGARTHSEVVRLLCRAPDANGTRAGAEPTHGAPVREGIR